jgi:hypothetical protein
MDAHDKDSFGLGATRLFSIQVLGTGEQESYRKCEILDFSTSFAED